MDATWHSGPRGSATRAHAAPTRQGDVCHYLHTYFTYYIVHKVQPSVYRKGIQPSKPSRLINASISFNFFRVGLNSHTVFICRTHGAGGASDQRRLRNPCVNRVDARTIHHDQSKCVKRRDYNGSD